MEAFVQRLNFQQVSDIAVYGDFGVWLCHNNKLIDWNGPNCIHWIPHFHLWNVP